MVRLMLALAMTVAVTVVGVVPASAHASFVSSDPKDGAVLDKAPDRLTLTFNEEIVHPTIVVTAPDGSSVEVSDVVAEGRVATAVVADPRQRGQYTAAFRVVSVDGHPIDGTTSYEVTTGDVVVPRASTATAETGETNASFLDRYRTHLFWGILAAGLAVVLLLEPLRRRDDTDDA